MRIRLQGQELNLRHTLQVMVKEGMICRGVNKKPFFLEGGYVLTLIPCYCSGLQKINILCHMTGFSLC